MHKIIFAVIRLHSHGAMANSCSRAQLNLNALPVNGNAARSERGPPLAKVTPQ
jgi:hypothetical protein